MFSFEAMLTPCVDLRTTATANASRAEVNTQAHANGHATDSSSALSHKKQLARRAANHRYAERLLNVLPVQAAAVPE